MWLFRVEVEYLDQQQQTNSNNSSSSFEHDGGLKDENIQEKDKLWKERGKVKSIQLLCKKRKK